MAQILFTLTSNCDFNVKHSNISFSENNWSLLWTPSVMTSAFKRTERKFHGFQQTDMVDKYFILSIWEVYHHSMWSSQFFFKRENKFMTSCCQPHLLLKLVIWMIRLSHINLWKENHGKKWHRFWLRLHHAVIFISNVQILASVQNKLIGDLNSNCHDCIIQTNREKVQWFLGGWYGRISHRWKKFVDDETWLHLVSFVNSL